MAYYGGVFTRDKGYLTFNPLKYTHPVYSILLPMIFLWVGLACPAVYIETWRLRGERWESAASLAGPVANLVLAVVLLIVLHFAPVSNGGIWPGLAFLGLLRIMAVVLNLNPRTSIRQLRVVSPFLDPQPAPGSTRLAPSSCWWSFSFCGMCPS